MALLEFLFESYIIIEFAEVKTFKNVLKRNLWNFKVADVKYEKKNN